MTSEITGQHPEPADGTGEFNRKVTVEVGDERYPAVAAAVDPAEHDALWARQVAVQPQFGGYRTAARTVPLVALTRV
ncbi:hypothetical protein ACIRYZ_21430 [Kitasatospora sp. NPDC101155]|uniref:hypothetical protein n=1 Tax=Kitasatospora sp. NPDC101155 TaxID=3364097 RepID=UPI00381E431D